MFHDHATIPRSCYSLKAVSLRLREVRDCKAALRAPRDVMLLRARVAEM